MKRKRIVAFLLISVMLLSILGGCGGGKETGPDDVTKISYWLPVGEDSTYYMSYEDNPAVKYLETLEFNGKKVDLSFVIPISGSERDNFNTLLATDEYTHIMDMSFSPNSPIELLEDDVIWDLTPYMEEYMPNYMKILENNPELKAQTTMNIDGERKVLSIYAMTEEILGNFMGFLYRRDWVAKYGKHPQTGESFEYGFSNPDDNSTWYDNVVFPSGGEDPVYLSDWEWMFDIFTKAQEDLGITDGYSISVFYKGYHEDGTLFNAFGGYCPLWYKDLDENAAFGGDSEGMLAYLECLNNWYNKGWLDKDFAERTNDMAYAINSEAVHSGKIGMWIGRRAETGAQMDAGDKFTSGIMVYGARPPINDLYGPESTRNKTPYTLYQYSRVRNSLVVTKKVSEEDLPTVLQFLDYFYTPEGAALLCFGLTKEQFEETQDETYIKFGVTDGAYRTEVQEDGSIKYIRNEKLINDNNLASALAGKRMAICYYFEGFVPALNASYTQYARNAMAEWDYYVNTGYPGVSFNSMFTAEESNTYNKIYANVDTYMSTTIPKFIKGSLKYDSDKDWDDYVKILNKYSPEKVTTIYQRVFDSLK